MLVPARQGIGILVFLLSMNGTGVACSCRIGRVNRNSEERDLWRGNLSFTGTRPASTDFA